MGTCSIFLVLSFGIHVMMIAIASETESKRKTLVFYPLLVLNMVRSGVQTQILEPRMRVKIGLCLVFCESFYMYFVVLKMKKYSNSDLLNIALVLCVMFVTDCLFINNSQNTIQHAV